jgi:hypothetical protein
MWESRPLATLGASTACNRDIFTVYQILHQPQVERAVEQSAAYCMVRFSRAVGFLLETAEVF